MPKDIMRINDIREVTTAITTDTCLVFTDLDETLLVPNVSFIKGVDICDYKLELFKEMYEPSKWEKIAKEIKNYYFEAESFLVQDEVTKAVIDELRETRKNVRVFGLTSRGYRDPYTPKLMSDLEELGIEFDKFEIAVDIVEESSGILFTNHKRKGPILCEFLEKIYVPWLKAQDALSERLKVIFIDNTLNKCINMLECFHKLRLEDTRFDFQIFHYVKIEELITTEDMFEDLVMITNKVFQ